MNTSWTYVLSAFALGYRSRAKFKAKETAEVLTKSETSNFRNINFDYGLLRRDAM